MWVVLGERLEEGKEKRKKKEDKVGHMKLEEGRKRFKVMSGGEEREEDSKGCVGRRK